jgi:parallel beta-helix repeat protein
MTIVRAVSPAAPGLYDARKAGVTADGTTDDRAAVVAAISAASATGSALQLPTGTIRNAGLAIELAAGVRIAGYGKTATKWTGPGFIITDNNEISGIGFDGTTAATAAAVATKTDVQHVGGYVHDCDFKNYGTFAVRLASSADNSGATRMVIANNTFATNGTALLGERVYDCRIEGNTSINSYGVGFHISMYGGSGNVIVRNNTVGGITGVTFVYHRGVAGTAGKIRGNVIADNRIVTPSEEGLSLDCHGNEPAAIAVVDYATVSSIFWEPAVPQMQVTLDAAFAAGGSAFYDYDLLFMSGALAGQVYSIDGASNRVMSLNRFNPNQSAAIVANDAVAIGAVMTGNSITGNTIEHAGTYGIVLWGMCASNSITNNTVRGTRSGSAVTGTISLMSQDGLAVATNNVSARSGKGPVTNNVVANNTLTDTNLVFDIVLYGVAVGYTTLGNRSVGNVFNNGNQVVNLHTLAT